MTSPTREMRHLYISPQQMQLSLLIHHTVCSAVSQNTHHRWQSSQGAVKLILSGGIRCAAVTHLRLWAASGQTRKNRSYPDDGWSRTAPGDTIPAGRSTPITPRWKPSEKTTFDESFLEPMRRAAEFKTQLHPLQMTDLGVCHCL